MKMVFVSGIKIKPLMYSNFINVAHSFSNIPEYHNLFEKLFREFACFLKWCSNLDFLRCVLSVNVRAPDTQEVRRPENVVKIPKKLVQ